MRFKYEWQHIGVLLVVLLVVFAVGCGGGGKRAHWGSALARRLAVARISRHLARYPGSPGSLLRS